MVAGSAMLLLAVSCGSTVPLSTQQAGTTAAPATGVPAATETPLPGTTAAPAGAMDGLGGTGDTPAPAGQAPTGTQPAGPAPSAGEPDSAAAPGAPAPAGGAQAAPAGNPGATGPGITADKLHVGIFYTDDGDEANEATGFESSSADARDIYNALFDDVNRRGGVLGRDVVPVYYRGSAATSRTISEQAQAACSHWHEDNEVFAIVNFPHPVALECTRKVGGVHVTGVLGTFPAEFFTRYPELAEVAGMDVEQQAAATVNGLARQDYFPRDAKVGILTFDTPGFHRAVDSVAKPALARLGVGEPEVAYISPPQSVHEVGNSNSQIQSAVLQFNTEGVTHVLILEGLSGVAGGGHLMLFFMLQAEAQAYRPRYGLNSGNALNAVSPQAPSAQLEDALAVGWVDPYDVPEKERMDNATIDRCRAAFKRKGLPTSGYEFASAMHQCDSVFFFAAAANRGGAPNRDGFVAGVDATGTSYTSAVTFDTRFAPDQHDGVVSVRNAAFDEGCTCWHYTSKPYRP